MLALRAVRYVGVIIAIGAGIRIGAAFFDLIPEAVEHLGSLETAMLWTAFGFLAFYAIDKLTALHVGHETAAELDHDEATHQHVGVVGAVGMGIHSFLDGVALAAGLAVGGGLGIVIAVVVDRPPVQRRHRRRQLPAGQPRAVGTIAYALARARRDRPGRWACCSG